MQEGNGTYYYVDGRIYKGGWTEGVQTGKGSMTFPDGDSYVGDWDSGNMNGWGAFYWNNGNSYQVRQWPDLSSHSPRVLRPAHYDIKTQ